MFLDDIIKDSGIGKMYQAMIQPLVMAVSPKYIIGAIVGGLAKAALAKKAGSAVGKGLAKTGVFGRTAMNNPGAFGNMLGGFFGGNPLGGLGAIGKGVGLFGKAGGFGSGAGKLAQIMGRSGAGRALQGGFQGMMGGLGAPGAQMNPMASAIGGAGAGMVANMPRLQGIMNKGLFGGRGIGQGMGIFGGQGGFGSGQGFLSRIGQGGEGFMGKFGTGQGAIANMAPNFRTGQGRLAQMFNKGGAGNTGNMGYAGQRGPFGRTQGALGGQPGGGNNYMAPTSPLNKIQTAMQGGGQPGGGGGPVPLPSPYGAAPGGWLGGQKLWDKLQEDKFMNSSQLTETTKDDENDAYGFLGGNQGGWI